MSAQNKKNRLPGCVPAVPALGLRLERGGAWREDTPSRRRVKFANTAPEETPTGLPNDFLSPRFSLTRGGDLFIPYGDFQHKKGLQKFDRAGAQDMANGFRTPPGWVRKLWHWFTNDPLGVPIYIGHPDVPELRGRFNDSAAYGWVEGLEPQAEGMLVKVKWSSQGQALIENGLYRYFSPYWFGAAAADGAFRINFLRSIGLTNEPNIPVPALANTPEDPSPPANPTPPQPPMNPKIRQLLGLADDADETAIENAISAMKQRCNDLEAQCADLKTKQTAAANDLSAAQTQLSTAQAEAKAARGARVSASLERLVNEGRVIPASREVEETRLMGLPNEADVTAELVKLSAAEPKLKTPGSAKTAPAAGQRAGLYGQPTETSVALANAIEAELTEVRKTITDPARAYDAAWQRVRSKKPELFAAKPAA